VIGSEQRLALPFAAGGVVCLILAAVLSSFDGAPRSQGQPGAHGTQAQAQGSNDRGRPPAQRRADKRAQRLAAQLAPTLSAGEDKRLQSEVRLAAALSPDIIEIGVVDADMTVLACSEPERVAKPAAERVRRAVQASMSAGSEQVSEDAAAQRLTVAVPLGKPLLATLYLIKATTAPDEGQARGEEPAQDAQAQPRPGRVPVWLIIGLGLLGLGAALIILWLAERRRGPQVMRLQETVEQMMHGHFEARLDPAEVPALAGVADRLNVMAEGVQRLQAEKEAGSLHASRIAEELQSAQVVQQTLMPDVRRLGRGPLQLCGVYRPASKLSGDWWHYYPLDEHRTLLVLADVLGHGIGAAVVGAMAYGCAAQLHNEMGAALRPDQLLTQLNRVIWATTRGKYTMSCFAAIIDTRECQLTYASGAHAFPLLFRYRDTNKPFVPLVAAGSPLGSSESAEFQSSAQAFEQGDLLICYTDGLVEAPNAAGDPFGDKRVRMTVQRCYRRNVEEICEIILGEVSRFVGSTELDDDQTLVVARNLPLGASGIYSGGGTGSGSTPRPSSSSGIRTGLK
jgi:serine phosphatase RsbU (regulator of sigma subunit)